MNTKLITSLTLVFLLLCSMLASGVADTGDDTNLDIMAEEGYDSANFIDIKDKPVFLFFYIVGCHPCQQQKPIIDQLEQEYGEEVTFIRINGEENPQMLEEFGVGSFPAMFLITDKNEEGYVYREFAGFTEKSELVRGIESATKADGGIGISSSGSKFGAGGDTNYPENTGFERWYYFVGGMVNAKNGNLYLSEEDIGIKARSFRLSTIRSYNSLNSETDSPFGKGWAFNYNTSLKEQADNDVTLFRGDGAIYNFTCDSGSYIPPAGMYEKLTKNDTGFSLWFKDGVVYCFNLNGVLQHIQCKNGNKLNFNYAGEKLTAVSDDSGLSLNFTYAGDRISRVSDPLGRTIKYHYNGDKLETVTDAKGANVTYKYTDAGMLESRINRVGGTTLFFYDNDKVEQISLALYNSSSDTYSDAISRYSITYDTAANETTFMNGRGYPTTIKYNENGNPVGITDALEGVTEINWINNSMVNLTDANGNLFSYEYGAYGNLINKTDPLGNHTLYTWDVTDTTTKYITLRKSISEGQQEQNVTTRYNYDSDGNLVELIDALGNSSYYEHDSYGNLINQTNFRGLSTLYSYDTHGNQIAVTDALGNITSYDYDLVGRMLDYTNARGFSTTYTYNKNDNILNITDATGNVTEYAYNAAGALVETKDEAGWGTNTTTNVLGELASLDKTSYKYDENGNLIEETDALGRKTRYEYDALDRLINLTDALNQSATHEYDSLGNLIDSTNKRGFSSFYEYDALSRVIKYTDSGGAIFYRYDGIGNLINVMDKLGNPTLYAYDNLSRVTKISFYNGDNLSYGYDENSNLIRFGDGNGFITSMEYDALDRMVKEIDPTGNFSTYGYDELDNLIRMVDKRGFATSYEYDALDMLTKITDSLGNAELFKYDERGNLVAFTDKRGHETEYCYDELMRLIRVKDSNGSLGEYRYDEVGNLISTKDPNGNETTYSYDELNRLKRLTNPLDDYTEFSYDPEGNVEKLKDFRGFVTEFNYDALNRLVSVEDSQGNVLGYKYNAVDKIISLTDPLNRNITFRYDGFGAIINVTSPLGNTTEFTFDSNGNMISRTDAMGRLTNYTYDKLNRRVQIEYAHGSRNFAYDADGNILNAANTGMGINYSIDLTYNALNRLTSAAANFDNFSKTLNYTYDATGNVISMNDSDGRVLTMDYEFFDKLTKITDSFDNVTSISYDRLGQVDSITYPNGINASYSYDKSGNVMKLYYHYSNGTLARFYDYAYDENANIVEMSVNEGTTSYVYDSLNQLTNVTDPSGWENFTYDTVGNIIERATESGTSDYSYNEENQLLADGIFTYAYDNNGNLISKVTGNDTTYYAYDLDNRLTGIKLPTGTNISYAYSPLGSRIYRDLNGSAIYSVFNREDVIVEYNASGVPKAEYVLAGRDFPVTMRRDGLAYYYLRDVLGSIDALTDAQQNIVETYEYDAFGNTTKGVIENPYRFTAREYEPDAGLYYYRLRFYDPTPGRFTSKDPMGIIEGPNLYSYVDNNPTNYADPFGLGKDYGNDLVPRASMLLQYDVGLYSFEDFKSRYQEDIEGLRALCEGYGGTFDERCFEDTFIRGSAYRNYLMGASALTGDFRRLMMWQFDERDKILKSELKQIEGAKDVMILSSINEAVKNIPYIGTGYGVVEAVYFGGVTNAPGTYLGTKALEKNPLYKVIGKKAALKSAELIKLNKKHLTINSEKWVSNVDMTLDAADGAIKIYSAYTGISGAIEETKKKYMPNTKGAMNTLSRLYQAKLDNLRKEAEKGLERAYQAQLQSTMEECCKVRTDDEEIAVSPPLEEIERAVGDEPVVAVSAKSECPPPRDPRYWRFYGVENCGGSPCECNCVYKHKAYYKYRTEAIRQCNLDDSLERNTLLTRDYTDGGEFFDLAKDGITLDCNGHTLDGGGVRSLKDKVTIKNCVIVGVHSADLRGAIHMSEGNGIVIRGNTITNCFWRYGICLIGQTMIENVIIEDNLIENSKESSRGIFVQVGNNITISMNTVYNNSQGGIDLDYIYNSTITENNVSNNRERGIQVCSGNNNTISNNTISNTSCRFGRCALLVGSDNSVVSNNRVTNTTDPRETGDYLPNSIRVYGAQNVSVINNEVLDNDGRGICAYESNDTTIKDNVVLNCTKRSAYEVSHGIYLYSSSNCTLTNNTAYNGDYYGIYLDCYSNYSTLTSNTVSNNSGGIYLAGSNCTLRGNTASNNYRGIYLSSSNSTLTNNTASNNRYDGICLSWHSNNNTLIDNTASNNSDQGIYMRYSCNNNTLTNNTAWNNGKYGVYLKSSRCNNIEKNTIVRNTTNDESWSISVDSEAENNTFKENTVGSKYPTKISVYDYYEAFKIRGVENPPESPKPPEYSTTGQNISNYVEMQNLSENTTLFIDFHYEDKDVKDINEETLKVWKHNGTAWVEDSWNSTRKLDTENNIVGVEVNEFCIFAPLVGMPVHNTDTEEDFNTIQEAIDDEETEDGHTITVDRGYTEAGTKENIFVDKELTIKSTSGDPADTVIEAADEGEEVIEVVENDVTIQGFTIKGATHEQGVVVDAEENVDIKNCIVRDNYFGVLLDIFGSEKSTYCTIQNCQFTSNTNGDVYINQSDYNNVFDCTLEDKYGVIIDSGTENNVWDNTFTNNAEAAIHVFSGRNNSIKDNQITGARRGMFVENTEENEISGNKIENADECGVKLDNSENNNLLENEVSSTPTGFSLLHSDDNTVEDCCVSGSVSGAIMGIDLQDSKRNTITGCSIHDLYTIGYSATGIRMFSGATHNKIYHSTISGLDASKTEAIDVGSPLNEFYNVTINGIISRGNSEGKGIDVWAYANSNIFNKVKISGVSAKNNSFGFYLYENNHNTIESCTVTNVSADYNNAHGLHLNRSNSTTITNTTLKWINATSNDSAILIEGTDGTNMFDNVTLGAEYPTSFNLTYSGDIEIDEVEIAPEDPDGGENISKYVAVTNNTAARVLLKISYSDSELGEVDESSLKMWRHDGEWTEVPSPNGVNTDENYVYANISEFSVFAPLNVTAPSPCYIATATYGTPLDGRIDVLRDFRDNVLVTNPFGETFVSTYYATSPPIADALRENDGLRTVTRLTLITPLVYLSKIALNGILLVFSIGLAVGLLFRRDRMKILRSLLVGMGSILVFIAAIFSLGSAGHTIPFCAGIGAYLLPFVIPISVGLTVGAIWKMKGKTIGAV